MTPRDKMHFYSEWEFKAYFMQAEPDPLICVSAVMCLLDAEPVGGRWRMEFIDQAFAHNFSSAQQAFNSMAKAQRSRLVVTIFSDGVKNEVLDIGKCYLLKDFTRVDVCAFGGTFGYTQTCPRFLYNQSPDQFPY